MTAKTEGKALTPEAELESWIDRLGTKEQKLFRSLRAAMRKQFPMANELAYDYTSHVVISYSPNENGIDASLAIDGRGDGVRLYLMKLPAASDPKKLLQGTGKQARFVPIESESTLARPEVKALIAAAVAQAAVPLPSKGKGALIMKSGAAAKRPSSRKAAK